MVHPKYAALGDDSLRFTSFEGAMSRSSGFSVIFRAGAMLYSVPDPSEIPCFAISEDDGKKLCSALEVRKKIPNLFGCVGSPVLAR